VSLLDLPARELLDRLAAPDPTPGGGSAAALAGAAGAALAAMVCAMPRTRTGGAEEKERLATALAWAREAGARLRRLVEEDTAAYDAVVAAYRLPKGTDEEKAARRSAIEAAMRRATDVPLETAEACQVALRAAQEAAANGNPNALSDARTAATLAFAGLVGAAENVRINAPALGEAASGPRLETLEKLLEEGRALARTLRLFG
jgi:formiminotetrahydrofolate cyclodeaminase